MVFNGEECVVNWVGGDRCFVESCERGVHFLGVGDSVTFAAVVVMNAHVEDETFLNEKEDCPESRKHKNIF